MSSITLTVTIDATQIESLKSNGFNLCLAKASANGSEPTVIWHGAEFLNKNTFEWQDGYKVFGSVPYKAGALVSAQTNSVPIGFGQTATIDVNGMMGPAQGTVDTSGSFKVINKGNPIHIGVTCSLTIAGSLSHDLPFFVSASDLPTGDTMALTPSDRVSVWFEAHGEKQTMIWGITGKSIIVDFTGNNPKSQTVTYNKEGIWQPGPLPEGGSSGNGGK